MEQRRKPNPESPMNASPSGTFLCANQELIAQSIVEMKRENNFSGPPLPPRSLIGCDPEAILSNLSSLEHRIHQVQDAVRTYMSSAEQAGPNELVLRQQLVAADLTSIIVQLISAAGTLIPSLTAGGGVASPALPCPASSSPAVASSSRGQGGDPEDRAAEEEDLDDGDGDGENLAAGTYEVLQLEKEEILAPHTHFCVICGKGFKRDANLRMHMRGHGDEYKTLAALAKPCKDQSSDHGGGGVLRRYSCPFVGCKRNKEHKKFQPLKTILCVKNHYKRSHCAKSFTCSRCNRKKFSVIADLKTHEKHCGRDKWVCSCGTTFSRKDKLFGHVSLFQGHAPAIPFGEPKATPPPPPPESVAGGDMFEAKELETEVGPLSPFFNFDTFDFEGGGEFIQPAFESPDGSFFFSSSSSSMLRIIPGGFPPPSAGTS